MPQTNSKNGTKTVHRHRPPLLPQNNFKKRPEYISDVHVATHLDSSPAHHLFQRVSTSSQILRVSDQILRVKNNPLSQKSTNKQYQ
jgi:hypothetical protein